MPPSPVSVLTVDDHAVVRESLSVYLDDEPGLVVWGTAASGDDALAQLSAADEAGGPDVVVSDLQMPGISGVELVAQVGTRHPGLPCLMFLAHAGSPWTGRWLSVDG